MVAKEKPNSEIEFENYLTRSDLNWEYEPALGVRKPDYLVHASPRDVLVEVEGFADGDIDHVVAAQIEANPIRLPDGTRIGGVTSGSWDPVSRVRSKIRAGIEQLHEYKCRYPCVIVVHSDGLMVDLGDFIVLSAMFGDPNFRLSGGQGGGFESGFGPDGRVFTPTQNTTISAVAVLTYAYPNRHILEDALRRQHEEDVRAGITRKESLKRAWELAQDIQRHHGEHFIGRKEPRLEFFHNPHAVHPLQLEAFPNPTDQHTRLDPATNTFRPIM